MTFRSRLLELAAIAAVAFAVLGIAALFTAPPASAHHVESRPRDARLAELYPGLIHPGFRWATLHDRWNRTHPAAVREHVIPYEAEFQCIARWEAGDGRTDASVRWDVNTGNGYFGGLQMDRNFQRAYGATLYRTKGTANNWTREEQIRVAARAVPRRGFWPWPNTARFCGLLP